jgi:hypothetical protein
MVPKAERRAWTPAQRRIDPGIPTGQSASTFICMDWRHMAELLESDVRRADTVNFVGAHLIAGLETGRSRLARMPNGGIADTVVARTNCVSGGRSRRAGSRRARRGQSALDIRWYRRQGVETRAACCGSQAGATQRARHRACRRLCLVARPELARGDQETVGIIERDSRPHRGREPLRQGLAGTACGPAQASCSRS